MPKSNASGQAGGSHADVHADVEEQLRARLAEVARRYPQAEIARRTATPPYNVSRYLRRGNRIPGAFLVAVARELGVNAIWLLQGEGTPWVADIRSDQADVGGSLLELVSSMASVSRLRLGSLVGKDDAKSLRALNDTLGTYERLRSQLAQSSMPAFRKVLDDWTTALRDADIPRARHLAAAAEQVERLCPEPALGLRALQLRAMHEGLLGMHEKSFVLRQRVFLQLLSASGEMDERVFMAAFGVVAALINMGRAAEGVRYAEAAQILAPDASTYSAFTDCQGLLGWGLISMAEFDRGLPLAMRAMRNAKYPQNRENARVAVAYAMYLCGTTGLETAVAEARDSSEVLGRLLFLCPWAMDAGEVARVMRAYKRTNPGETTAEKETIAGAHLAALEGRHKEAMQLWKLAESDEVARRKNPLALDFALLAMRTQLLRLANDKPAAQRALNEAEAARNQVPGNVAIDLNWQRIHWRNAAILSKSGSKLSQQSAAFATWAKARGMVVHEATEG